MFKEYRHQLVGANGAEISVYKSLKALIFRRVGIAHMAYFSAIPGRGVSDVTVQRVFRWAQ